MWLADLAFASLTNIPFVWMSIIIWIIYFYRFFSSPTNDSTAHTWRNSRISIIHAEKVHSGTYSCSIDNTTSSTVNIQILMGKLGRFWSKKFFFIFTPRRSLRRRNKAVGAKKAKLKCLCRLVCPGNADGVKYVHKISNQDAVYSHTQQIPRTTQFPIRS